MFDSYGQQQQQQQSQMQQHSEIPSMNFALVKYCDMPEEMRQDVVETVSTTLETTLEKNPRNFENAAKLIKEQMDRKYGKNWHCIIGEGFGFNVSCEMNNLLYLYYNGTLAVLVFKDGRTYPTLEQLVKTGRLTSG